MMARMPRVSTRAREAPRDATYYQRWVDHAHSRVWMGKDKETRQSSSRSLGSTKTW